MVASPFQMSRVGFSAAHAGAQVTWVYMRQLLVDSFWKPHLTVV